MKMKPYICIIDLLFSSMCFCITGFKRKQFEVPDKWKQVFIWRTTYKLHLDYNLNPIRYQQYPNFALVSVGYFCIANFRFIQKRKTFAFFSPPSSARERDARVGYFSPVTTPDHLDLRWPVDLDERPYKEVAQLNFGGSPIFVFVGLSLINVQWPVGEIHARV